MNVNLSKIKSGPTYMNDPEIKTTNVNNKNIDFFKWIKGTASIRIWDKTQYQFTRTAYRLPSPVASYNCFMNSVDVMDQVIKVPRRKEASMYTKFLSYIINWSTHNAYAIYQAIENMIYADYTPSSDNIVPNEDDENNFSYRIYDNDELHEDEDVVGSEVMEISDDQMKYLDNKVHHEC